VKARAVLLDALGTLVRLDPPAPALRAELLRTTGIDVGKEAAARGFGAEIAYYLEHHMEGGDPPSLERLRDRCAQALAHGLGVEGLHGPMVREAMLSALRFSPFPDVEPALRELRSRGVRLVAASNWDCSLPEWLEEAGVLTFLDGAVSSAVVGWPKPDPAVFLEALRVAGAGRDEAIHVGDSLENDVEGARRAGVRAILIDRDGRAPDGVQAVRSLEELPSLT
jgi:putative hydrolase of the HAD superfamily